MLYRRIAFWLLAIAAFAIPVEHKYDKAFRFFSLKLIPENITLPTFFDKKIYFYATDLIATVLFAIALYAMRGRLVSFFSSRGAIYLWGLFLLSFVSILVSPLSHYPLLYIRLLQLFTPILLYCWIANGFEPEQRDRLAKTLLLVFLAAASIQSVIAIVQHAIQGPLGLRLLGEQNTFSTFLMHGEKAIRASGTLPHPNLLGGFLTVSILASYSFFFTRLRPFFFVLIPLQFFAMCLAFSRSALFGLAIGTLVWLCLSRKRSLAPLLSVLAFSLLSSFAILYEPIVQRGGIVNYNKTAKGSDALRMRYQNIALNMIKDHPLFGAGFQQTSIRSLDYAPDDPHTPASGGVHNIYLYMAAETGLPSLIVFLCFIITLFSSALRAPFSPALASLIAIFSALLFIGGCDFYPLLFQQGKLPFFMLAGLLAAYAYSKKELAAPARVNIWKMFDTLSPHYDRLNAILSFGMDRGWRRRVASHLPKRENLRLLDLATGTADQLIACFESGASIQSGVGVDLSAEMLKIGNAKLSGKPYRLQAALQMADVEKLPFHDASFDATTFSFGIRNIQSPLASLKEIHRVLKPGGRCLILELSMPPQPLRGPHLFYLRHILPRLGGFLSKQKQAYTYLNQTIETFPSGTAFCSLMESASFRSIETIPMALGAVTLYLGEKNLN
jgi:demethylmenaquinone methyltransferase/2-methoxy-6-polyprenyl-1,4-benzoquinol methylase